MPRLSDEVIEARINLRLCELRVLAAQMFVELGRRPDPVAVARVLPLPDRRRP
jgi:hypothetical protein